MDIHTFLLPTSNRTGLGFFQYQTERLVVGSHITRVFPDGLENALSVGAT